MNLLRQLALDIRSLPEAEFWALWAVSLVLSLLCWFYWLRKARRARLIEDVPTSTIRAAAQGYTELVGNAAFLPDGVIRSPLTGRECVWYRYQVEKKERRQGKNDHWKTIEKETCDDIFLLEDETGQCVIDPHQAEVISYEKKTWYGQHRRPGFIPGQSSLLDSLSSDYRYTEEWIEAAEVLYAIGHFETEGTGEELPQLRDEVRELLKQWKENPNKYLRRFDKNSDGKIDLEEWAKAREAAHKQVVQQRLSQEHLPQMHVMRKPEHGQPYILSSLNPDELLKRYKRGVRLLLPAAIGLGGICVWLLNARL